MRDWSQAFAPTLSRLEPKAGAGLSLQHGSKMVVLNQSLVQQGIAERGAATTAGLSCAYIPMRVADAWRFMKGLPVDEEEFALQGLTEIEGVHAMGKLQHMPLSLRSLTFGDAFNQSLEEAILPRNLERLVFGHQFDKCLEQVHWPRNLQSLTLGQQFNQPLQGVEFPASLQSLALGEMFDQPLVGVQFPMQLQQLTLGNTFNQSLDALYLLQPRPKTRRELPTTFPNWWIVQFGPLGK